MSVVTHGQAGHGAGEAAGAGGQVGQVGSHRKMIIVTSIDKTWTLDSKGGIHYISTYLLPFEFSRMVLLCMYSGWYLLWKIMFCCVFLGYHSRSFTLKLIFVIGNISIVDANYGRF